MADRGTFRSRQHGAQLIRFDGLRWGIITPTDTDVLIDFHGRGFVLAELKHRDTQIRRGQELAIERAVDTWERGGVPSVGIIASHAVDIGDVMAADAIVTRIRWRGQWNRGELRPRTLGQTIQRFYERHVARAA